MSGYRKGVPRKQAPYIRQGLNLANLRPTRDETVELTPEQKAFINDMEITKKALSYDPKAQLDAAREAMETGYKEGYEHGTQATVKFMMAASALALRELHGWGAGRCQKFLERTAELLLERVDTVEAMQAVWDAMGLEFVSSDPLEQIQKVRDVKPRAKLDNWI